MANEGNRVYSTGPIENQGYNDATVSKTAVINILNNDRDRTVEVRFKVFALNGSKDLLKEGTLNIPPLSSDRRVVNVDVLRWEVQILVVNEDDALLSVWGKDRSNILVAAHRVLHDELILIDALSPSN